MNRKGSIGEQAFALAVGAVITYLCYTSLFDLFHCETAGVGYNAMAFLVAVFGGVVGSLVSALAILKFRK